MTPDPDPNPNPDPDPNPNPDPHPNPNPSQLLAQEFAVTKPSGLRGLILSGALADGALAGHLQL